MVGRRSALIVATQTYEDAGLTRLQAPAADAQALADVLADPAIGDFDVTTLVDKRAHEVSRAVAEFFHERRPDDLLLLHFSCHGLKDDSGELYFAATDTDLDLLDATAVPSSFVNRAMDRSRAGRVLLLLDCCYAGAFARGLTARAGGAVDVNERLGGRGRAVITASSALQFAFEGQAPDDVASAAPSVFTSALVRGLRTGEADRDLDGLVSLDELYAYVHDEVTRDNPDQTPKKWAFDIEGDLYVAKRGRPVDTPSELPAEIRHTIDSLLSWERASAVEPLQELLAGDHPGLALGARQALDRLAAEDDSARVREVAAAALASAALSSADGASSEVSTGALTTVTVTEPEVVVPPPREPVIVDQTLIGGPEQGPPEQGPPEQGPATPSGPADGDGSGTPTPWFRRPVALVGAVGVLVAVALASWLALRGPDGAPTSPGSSGGSSGASSPAALPDSTMLLTQVDDGPQQLVAYDVDADGGSTVPLVDDPTATLPTISPDRTQFVYLSSTPGSGKVPHLVDADGKTHDHLLLDAASRRTCPFTERPTWSPDGNELAFVCFGADLQSKGLWTVGVDGQGLRQLPTPGDVQGSPTWTGDGFIVFQTGTGSAEDPGVLMAIKDAPGSAASAVPNQPAGSSSSHPDWSSSGLLYLRTRPGVSDGVIVVMVQGGTTAVYPHAPHAQSPTWNADGTGAVWLVGAAGHQQVWTAAGVDKQPHQLAVSGTSFGAPAWGSR